MRKAVLIALYSMLLGVGCTRDRAIVPQPLPSPCDTKSAGYLSCIRPLFVTHCYSCHSDSLTQHGSLGFDIEDFAQLKTYLGYYYHGDGIYGSKFMHAIEHKPGVLVMPPSYTMPDSSISLIGSWISRGAPE